MYVEAESAIHEKLEKREQVRALLAEMRGGDLVLVDKIDRWSRDPEFTYRSVRQILAAGAGFFAIGDDCDPSTPEGDTMLGVRVLLAREDHKRIKQRLVGTRKTLRNHGYYSEGSPPWGYRRRSEIRGLDRNALIVDEVQADRVRTAFRLCIEGQSMMAIADHLGVDIHSVARVLHNRSLLGEVRDTHGQWITAKHPAIVDARTFQEAQLAVDRRRCGHRRSRADSTTAGWWLRDVARCAKCEAKMSSAWATRGSLRYDYFKCFAKCSTEYVAVKRLEERSEPAVVARLDELVESLSAPKASKPPVGPNPGDIAERHHRLQKKRARALEAFTDGHMSRDELREAMAKMDAERTRLDAIAQAPKPVSAEHLRAALKGVGAMARAWSKATGAERRVIVGAIAEWAFVEKDEGARFVWFSDEFLARKGEG